MSGERLASEQLQPGERLLWSGRPSMGPLERYTMRTFAVGMAAALAAGLTWILYFVLRYLSDTTNKDESALYGALRDLGPIAATVAAAALGLVAVAGVVGLIRGRWLTPRTLYALTDRRVLFIAGGAVHWIGRRELREVVAHQHADGTGDLIFVRDRSNLEQLNANRYGVFTREWLGELAEHFHLSRVSSRGGLEPSDDSGVREAFVGIREPQMVRDLVLTSLSDRGSDSAS